MNSPLNTHLSLVLLMFWIFLLENIIQDYPGIINITNSPLTLAWSGARPRVGPTIFFSSYTYIKVLELQTKVSVAFTLLSGRLSQFHVYFKLVILKSSRIFVWSSNKCRMGVNWHHPGLTTLSSFRYGMDWTQKVNYFKMYDGKCLRTVQFSR